MPSIDESYLGNPLLKKANTQIEFTPEQVLEFGRCIQDPVYFAENYIKIVTLDKGLQPFKMYDFQRRMLRSFHDNRFNICKLPRQCGKMLALDTPLPTKEGWTTIEKVQVGDTIFGKDGKPTTVISKSPIQFIDSYEIEFENGEKVKCCGQHLWEVSHINWKGRKRVITTNELIRLRKKIRCIAPFYVDVNESIETEEKDLPIDPYTLGVFIANGHLSKAMIFGYPDFLDDVIKNIKFPLTKKVKRRNANIWEYYFETFVPKLRELGLCDENRRIPMSYFRASTEQRVELLRGIMDAKGVVDKDIVCKFRTDDEIFIEEVKHLLSSLGIKYRTHYINAHLFGRKKIELLFTTCKYSLFKKYEKQKKQNRCSNHDKNYKLFIHKIRKIPTEPMQCISVDNDDHLFLCSKSFIPTHNSTTVVSYLLHFAVFNENVNIAILANKLSTARDLLGKLQTAYENLPKWLQQGVLSWNKGSLELENGSKIHAASTSASSVRGGTYNIIFLDEFAFVQNSVADQFFSSVYPTITSGKSSKVIIVSCVSKDTYLLTNKGYRKIDRFIDKSKEGAYIVPTYNIMGKDKFYESDVIVNNKKSITNIIKTSYETLECSQDHKLWVLKNGKPDYVKSKDLEVGDYVAVKYNQQVFGNLDYIEFDSKFKDFSGKNINKDLAYLMGLYVSKGFIRNQKGNEIVIKFNQDISDLLNRLNISYKAINNSYIINSKQFINFILSFRFNSRRRALPDSILSWSKNNIESLLKGILDANNSTFKSRELIRQVQLLLSNLGTVTSIENKPNQYIIKSIDYEPDVEDKNLIWFKIESIDKGETEVFDVSLPDIEGDDWCHSVLYNNFLGHQTPKGMNHFYRLWVDAIRKKNNYIATEVHWRDVPGRDDEFKRDTIKNTSESQWKQEFECVTFDSQVEILENGEIKQIDIGQLYKNLLE